MKNALIVTAASAAAAVALVLGGAAAADAATPAPSHPKAGASCSIGERFVHGWLHEPKALRTDLKNARKADKADRAKDIAAVRAKALAGGYGAVAEARVKDLDGLRLRVPTELKTDLKTLRGEKTRADKVKEADAIEAKALAGGYGTSIQKLAKDAQSMDSQNCTPGAKKSTSGS